ncbi:hypothetical protein EW026_g4936 [Hermanssonia centrifuga]|uniref:Transcription initiation factor TFIID subunit 4 n=1 Tax=Hermanssonia centrifuga TaxID=98765 RepID=A0A4S4KFP0_9APHY|nr:hypothetical protein EW026_g4936 [Hermanssonia centrifuga]
MEQFHQSTAYSHYQQYYAQTPYYQQYTPQTAQQQTQVAAPVPAPVKPVVPASTIDTTDVSKLNDALGSAGVDLRAEEESLQRSSDQYQSYRPYEDRSRKQPVKPNFDTRHLGAKIREFGTQHKVTKVPEESVNYMALALRARLQDLVEAMIQASEHRTDAQFERPASLYEDESPMWSLLIRADVAKQLATIERVEREEEMKVRRERKERAEMQAAHSAAMQAQQSANGMTVDGGDGMEESGPKKKKKKVDGPGVTARNMSEDVRKKMSNAVASQAAGLGTGKYAWMTASSSAAAAKPKATSGGGLSPATTTAPSASQGNGSTWARPYVPAKITPGAPATKEDDTRRTVTLRDAMFVIEKEKGHGGGRGAAMGWT